MVQSNKIHVLTYGDAFVDYIADNTTNSSFSMFLGGATVNVAVGIARLGVPSAGVLRYVHINGLPKTMESLIRCTEFANHLGALTATKAGALTALPRLSELKIT